MIRVNGVIFLSKSVKWAHDEEHTTRAGEKKRRKHGQKGQ